MSAILGMKGDLSKIPKLIKRYENELKNAKTDIALNNKTLEEALKEHSALQVYYDERKVELKVLSDYMEKRVDKERSKLYKKYTEQYNVSLSDREREKYINGEDSFITTNILYLEIKELYLKYEVVVNGFITRGFKLGDIVKARVAQIENTLL